MTRKYKKMKEFVACGLPEAGVLVVGDVMLDKYYFGEVKRISPEAPVPVTRITKEKETLGGAANVAHNLALLGCPTLLVGTVGRDDHRTRLEKLLTDRQIGCGGLMATDAPTTTKVRVIGGHQQMIRLDFEDSSPVGRETEDRILSYVADCLANQAENSVGAVILSDYAKGVCTPRLCQEVIQLGRRAKVPVIVDPKGTQWQKYAHGDMITPNLKELGEAVHDTVPNEDEAVQKAARAIRRRHHIGEVVVTRSEQGLSLIGGRRAVHVPTCAQEVFDVSGAGDTVIAVLGAAMAGGMESSDAAWLANLAAGVVVGKLGTYAIHRDELLQVL